MKKQYQERNKQDIYKYWIDRYERELKKHIPINRKKYILQKINEFKNKLKEDS